jgi:hypothetical protein
MRTSAKLTDAEKQNGKRAVLIPSEAIQKKMAPITLESFTHPCFCPASGLRAK